MSYNILGINPFHNGSVCVLSDGEIIYFLEEERLSRYKHDANPFRVILDILNRFKINEVVIAGINVNESKLGYSLEDPFYALIRKFYPKLPVYTISDYHHLSHCLHSYYNSGFSNALGIIIDSGGSFTLDKGIEMDSIYECSPSNIKNIYKHYTAPIKSPKNLNVGSAYSAITYYLGFKNSEEGKTMGLSSYGNYNSKILNLYKKNLSNINILYEEADNKTNQRNIVFKPDIIGLPQTRVKSKNYSQLEKDLAWAIQTQSQQAIGDYIEKNIQKTGLKQVCCSGGYFLNCVSNYYLTKRFPNIEFYFEPISHDGGTAIGAAFLRWKEINPNFTPKKQKTLYYGPKYSKKELLEGIKKYL